MARKHELLAETEEEVDSSDIIKGYEVGKGQYLEIQPEELEAIARSLPFVIRRMSVGC